jgi:hypothetical protein
MKKSDAQLWLESIDINDLPIERRAFLKYLKDLMNGKTPTEIEKERENENSKNSKI